MERLRLMLEGLRPVARHTLVVAGAVVVLTTNGIMVAGAYGYAIAVAIHAGGSDDNDRRRERV